MTRSRRRTPTAVPSPYEALLELVWVSDTQTAEMFLQLEFPPTSPQACPVFHMLDALISLLPPGPVRLRTVEETSGASSSS